MNANNLIVINKYVGTILFIFSVFCFLFFKYLVDIRSEACLNLVWKSINGKLFAEFFTCKQCCTVDICLGCELKAHHLWWLIVHNLSEEGYMWKTLTLQYSEGPSNFSPPVSVVIDVYTLIFPSFLLPFLADFLFYSLKVMSSEMDLAESRFIR